MSVTDIHTDEALNTFLENAKKDRDRYNAVVSFHLQARDSGVPLPTFSPGSTSNYVDQYKKTEDGKRDYFNGGIDTEASIEVLKKVVKFARKMHYDVRKEYSDYYFSVEVDVPATETVRKFTMTYNVSREGVCVKKVVGTKVVPAQSIPERIEEIVEWECEKLSLLK